MKKLDIVEEIMVLLKNKFGVESKELGHISLLDPAIGMLPRDLFTLFLICKKNMILSLWKMMFWTKGLIILMSL